MRKVLHAEPFGNERLKALSAGFAVQRGQNIANAAVVGRAH
jgi:hypothetical protein